jgi:hypothetical protein
MSCSPHSYFSIYISSGVKAKETKEASSKISISVAAQSATTAGAAESDDSP